MKIHTVSGTTYEFAGTPLQVRRIRAGDDTLRRDGEWIDVLAVDDVPVIGEEFIMILDLRKDGVATIRRTSTVTGVTL